MSAPVSSNGFWRTPVHDCELCHSFPRSVTQNTSFSMFIAALSLFAFLFTVKIRDNQHFFGLFFKAFLQYATSVWDNNNFILNARHWTECKTHKCILFFDSLNHYSFLKSRKVTFVMNKNHCFWQKRRIKHLMHILQPALFITFMSCVTLFLVRWLEIHLWRYS